MKSYILLIASIIIYNISFSQEIKKAESKENDKETKIVNSDNDIYNFYTLEQKPEFPGGEKGLLSYIAKHTEYPNKAKRKNITGKVYVQFIIDKEGKVTNVKVLRSAHPLLDKSALKVIKSLPDWKPGKQRGKNVKVSFQVPINYTLY